MKPSRVNRGKAAKRKPTKPGKTNGGLASLNVSPRRPDSVLVVGSGRFSCFANAPQK